MVNRRQTRERTIVRGMVRQLKRAGWNPVRGHNGGDLEQRVLNEKAALELFDSADQTVLRFMRANVDRPGSVLLIPGNGDDVISDYGGPPDFALCLDNYLDSIH